MADSAIAPEVVPLPLKIPVKVVAGAFPFTIVFLITLSVAPLDADALPFQNTTEVVPAFVFSMVRFLEVVLLLLPSIVIKSPPLILIIAAVLLPEITLVTPDAGLKVNVAVLLAPVMVLIVSG